MVVVLSGGARGKRVKMGQRLPHRKEPGQRSGPARRHRFAPSLRARAHQSRHPGSGLGVDESHARRPHGDTRSVDRSGRDLDGGQRRAGSPNGSNRAQILPSESPHFGEVLGPSLAMRSIFGVARTHRTDRRFGADRGRDGHRKDVLARAIHQTKPPQRSAVRRRRLRRRQLRVDRERAVRS